MLVVGLLVQRQNKTCFCLCLPILTWAEADHPSINPSQGWTERKSHFGQWSFIDTQTINTKKRQDTETFSDHKQMHFLNIV